MKMQVTTFYPCGPDRVDDVAPLQDAAEIAECRRIVAELHDGAVREIESYDTTSAEELGALRDLELWGYDPFSDYEE